MPVIVETPGAANANSFVSLAEFTTYIADRLHVPAAVVAATEAQKQSALIWATRLMNGLCYIGTATVSTQSLKFPMTGLTASNGYALSNAVIPQELKDATMELAFLLLQSDRTLENAVSVAGLTKLKAGPVELGFKDSIEVNIIPSGVKDLLPSSWLCPVVAKNIIMLEAM